MLCSLIVALALLACVCAEKSLRQAASAAVPVVELTKGHKNFLADYERRAQFRGMVDMDAEAVTMMAQNNSGFPSHIRFTGSVAQIQDNGGSSYTLTSLKLGSCHNHYKPRRSQAKSSMFYVDFNDDYSQPLHVIGHYYSGPNCAAEKFWSEGEFMNIPWMEGGASATWGSKIPQPMGLVESFYFGSECPAAPLPSQQAIFSSTSTPLGACQNEGSGGSHIMNGCYVANGMVYVNGQSFDQPNCGGAPTPIVDMSVGPTCKAKRNSFQVTTCVLP